jgi:hypothetical protein
LRCPPVFLVLEWQMRDDERSVINRIVFLLLKTSMYADRETSQQGGHIPVAWSL